MSFLLDHCCGLSRGQIIYDCRLFAFLTPAGTRILCVRIMPTTNFVTFVQYNVQRRVEFAVCKPTRLIFLTFHHVVGGEQERKIVGRIATFNHPLPFHSFSTFTRYCYYYYWLFPGRIIISRLLRVSLFSIY